jgi:hypothetical protein
MARLKGYEEVREFFSCPRVTKRAEIAIVGATNFGEASLIRILFAAALSIVVGACGGPQSAGWQKAGATDAVIAADSSDCRTIGQQQAARLYPFGSSSPTLGGAGMVAAQQQASTDRTSAETQFFNDCMEGRGYTRGKPAS